MPEFQVGDVVGAHRWPYISSHPDCWQKPHKGVVLSRDDPRAWAKTIAFSSENPGPEAIREHLSYCDRQGLLKDVVPVLWDFPDGQQVYWQQTTGNDALRLYSEDYLEWMEHCVKHMRQPAPELQAA